MPRKTKHLSLSSQVRFKFSHVLMFAAAFAALGIYAVLHTFAAPVSTLSECTVVPSSAKAGDSHLTVTAPVGELPENALGENYRVKLETPYINEQLVDAVYDAANGIAILNWNGLLVKGKHSFYFVYVTGHTGNSQVVRASRTCSINVN
ncbi:MAG TPA: hypothetical protein VF272_00875 [Candidatus Saccharimonadia bacterium]